MREVPAGTHRGIRGVPHAHFLAIFSGFGTPRQKCRFRTSRTINILNGLKTGSNHTENRQTATHSLVTKKTKRAIP